MKKFYVTAALLVAVSACDANVTDTTNTPIVLEMPEVIIRESPSPTIEPTNTATKSIPTILFEDPFAENLEPGWEWQNENAKLWSLNVAPGFLQINVVGGYVTLDNHTNLLLRPAPEGNFIIETHLEFMARRSDQFAGLILYESNENYIQAGRAYCAPVYGCVGRGIYLDFYQNRHLQLPRRASRFENDSVYLRLSREEDIVSLTVSENNKIWYRVTSIATEMSLQKIGIFTGQNLENEPVPAIFDYFIVAAID
jgi:beta-xylosidase